MRSLIVRARRHPWRLVSVLALACAVLIFALVYFAPQDLLINTSVNEPLPRAHVNSLAQRGLRAHRATTARAKILRHGRFSSGAHATSGTALLLRLADGRVFVRIENLSTSNGPAVRVRLTSAFAPASNAAVERGSNLDLGGLKANHGSQNYAVPMGATLSDYRSLVVWCARFKVVFGSAPLMPVR